MGLSARVAAASTAAALSFLTGLEVSKRIPKNEAHWDAIGKRWEICKGLTGPDVYEGLKLSDRECEARESARMEAYWATVEPCLKREPTFTEATAFKVWIWNIGTDAFCKSTMLKRWNAGDRIGACSAITQDWRFAGGKDCFVPANQCMGIKDRRTLEEALCADKVAR